MAALEPEDPISVGTYQLLGRLGVGGMGRVFLGRSPGGRAVAVKVVHAELVRRPEFRSRFRREVQAARQVSGAFTAPVIDADPDAPLPWLVTSYIAGPSLQQAVADHGPPPAPVVLALAAGLAEALMSIHAVGLVHRDLKPSNVLLAEDGPRVIDFGIARGLEVSSITGTGHVLGSPGYMSPEQVNGGGVTAASDVFALGAVLAYAATGANPFGEGPTPALLYRVVHTEPDIRTVTDPGLYALIAACLAKDPGRRPTPREVLAAAAPGAGRVSDARHWKPAAGHTRAFAPGSDLANPVAQGALPTRPGAAPAPGGRTRRALLLSGVGVAAAVGVTFAVRFTGSTGDRTAAAGAKVGGSSPSPSRASGGSVPEPLGAWPLTETSGTSAADTAGYHDGAASGVGWGLGKDGAAQFNGVSSQILTDGPVLATGSGQSFTVAAWVCLNALPDTFATAVSQDATTASGFYLQYSSDEQRWAFARPGVRALSYNVPSAGNWTHLTGVCDAADGQLRLYVDGFQQGATADTDPVDAPGSLMIGRATYQGRASDFFPGAIKDVRVFDQALTLAQIKTLS